MVDLRNVEEMSDDPATAFNGGGTNLRRNRVTDDANSCRAIFAALSHSDTQRKRTSVTIGTPRRGES